MKKFMENIIVILLVILSVAIYALQIFIFNYDKDTFFYIMQDLAFLQVQVALVTVVVGGIVERHEKQNRIEKTRMLAGTFFSEFGMSFLEIVCDSVNEKMTVAGFLDFEKFESVSDFSNSSKKLGETNLSMSCSDEVFSRIRKLLIDKKNTLLIISSNPSLLEHESFTDMLWAVFHLSDELCSRGETDELSQADINHLNADTARAVKVVLLNWICQNEYLKREYPYFYRFEVMKNPFVNRL